MAHSTSAACDPALPALAARTRRISFSATSRIVQQAEALRAQGVELIDLGVGEPDFATPAHIEDAAMAALEAGFTRYTPTGGTGELKQAICRAHARDYGSRYEPSEVLATVGGKHALFNAMSVLVERGDEVILASPYWTSFYDQITYMGGVPVLVPTRAADGFALAPERVEAAVTPRTKLLLINSPGNPSGAVLPRAGWQALLGLARRRGLWLLSDECYAKLVYDEAPYSVAGEPGAKSHVVIAGSMSKTYAMTGWRLGYALGPAPVIEAMLRLQSHTTSNPTSFVQKAAVAALLGTQDPVERMRQEYRARRAVIVARLRAIPGVGCELPGGAFYAFADIRPLLAGGAPAGGAARPQTAMDFAQRLLDQAGVVGVPGEAFGCPGHIRFSYAASVPSIEEGMRRVAAFCAGLGAAA